jgi:hypothetical protein
VWCSQTQTGGQPWWHVHEHGAAQTCSQWADRRACGRACAAAHACDPMRALVAALDVPVLHVLQHARRLPTLKYSALTRQDGRGGIVARMLRDGLGSSSSWIVSPPRRRLRRLAIAPRGSVSPKREGPADAHMQAHSTRGLIEKPREITGEHWWRRGTTRWGGYSVAALSVRIALAGAIGAHHSLKGSKSIWCGV